MRRIAVVTLIGLLSGCSLIEGEKEKSITIALDDALVTVSQGSRDSVIITITRKNLNQPVQLSVEGTLPSGVTTSFSQNPLPAGVSTTRLRFIAAGSAPPASGTVTLRASSEGAADKAEDIGITVALTGTYTLGTIEPSVTVAQGGAGDAIVLLTRSGGNASTVSLDVTGAPAGMFATVPTPVTERGTTLSITANSSVAPGTYPITITSSAAGITPDQTTQVSVVVIAPPSTASLTVPFCSTFVPVWFAFKNEGYGWQRVTPTGASFTFAATPKVAVAFVFQVGTISELDVYFASHAGLSGQSDRDCDGTKTLAGTVTGLTAGQTALVVMGANGATTTSGSYTLQGVASRPLDIIATRGTIGSGFLAPDKMIVRRAQDLTSTIPDLDFTSGEAFTPTTSNLTVSGFANGFSVEFRNDLWSATSTHGTVHSGPAAGGTATFSSAPAGQLMAGDLHELVVEGFQSNGLAGHLSVSYFAGTGDRTETLGPLLGSPTFSMPTVSPHTRSRAQLASQPEYPAASQFIFTQVIGGAPRYLNLVGTAPYYGSVPATWDLIVPDLSNVSGFSTDWMLVSGQGTTFTTIAYSGRDDLLFGALPIAGETYKLAYRNNNIPTILSLRRPGELAGRRAPLLNQYFRR